MVMESANAVGVVDAHHALLQPLSRRSPMDLCRRAKTKVLSSPWLNRDQPHIPTGDWPSSIIVIHEHRRHRVETQGANREENTSLPGAIRLQPGHHEPVRTLLSLSPFFCCFGGPCWMRPVAMWANNTTRIEDTPLSPRGKGKDNG